MKFTKFFRVSTPMIGLAAFAASAQAASLGVDFQATIASEQHPTYAGEARYYHVSVNPTNPGTGSYAATIVGTNDPAPSFVRNFTGDVVSYKFLGGSNDDISGVAASGGDASLITYATSDTTFDGFGQGQAKIWETTDPGADLATGGADPYGASGDSGGGGYRSFGGAVGTLNISGLAAGSVHIYYGSFNATPTVSVVMRDTDGPEPDITITDAHLNGDTANRTEYYLAEIGFVNDAGYDEIEYTWLANGADYLGNGRGLGTVLTGPAPDALLVSTDPTNNAMDVPVDQNLVATFSEDMKASIGLITIMNLSEGTQTVFSMSDPEVSVLGTDLTINPDVDLEEGDNYAIQIDAGAVTDLDNNPFAGITDDTTWNFTTFTPDTTAPTLDLIEDNKGGGPIFDTDLVNYTLTFSKAMNGSTIEVGDFSNSATATATITVVSVSPTVDPAVYEVVVSPTSLGTIQLQVNASADLKDLSGNPLDTSSAIPDDTVITVVPFTSNDGSLAVDFQATIASEQHPDYAGEARYYHVSVNPANPGTGSFAATIVGTNDPAPSFVRNYDGEVLSYKFLGGSNDDISGVAASGGDASLITYATSDTTFDGFGQGQAKIWETTDPGVDLATTGADPFGAIADFGGGGYRSFGGAVGTIDISGLAKGSVHIYYGSFNATPTVSVIMRDTDGPAPDITITDAHLNADNANRTEYYLAEIDFVTDGLYDEIEYTWLANGTDYTGNGRGLGTVLTGPATPPAPFAITDISYDRDDVQNPTVTLTWRKTGVSSYIARFSRNLSTWVEDLDDSITLDKDENTDDADQMTVTFPLKDGLENDPDLFFRIEEG